MDLRLKHPCTGLLAGSSSCGKTEFTKRLVENCDAMFNTKFQRIVWQYTEWQKAYEELRDRCQVDFVLGKPSLQDFPANQGPTLLIIDDLQDQLNNPELVKFFIKGSHHRDCSVFFLAQCLFAKGLRLISLNSQVCILFKTSRDLSQIRTFVMQCNPTNWRALMEAYHDATKESYSYLLFDFSQSQADHLRLRTKIFPGENTVVYIPKKLDYLNAAPQTNSSVREDGAERNQSG